MDPASTIYQFKVTLQQVRPPIWRRFQVPADLAFGSLHIVLQVMMGWTNSHLYQFDVAGKTIADGEILSEWEESGIAADEAIVADYVTGEGASFIYEYDFGDGWIHKVVLEKVLEAEPETTYPRCLAGKRACPPEDCGGPWGYADLLEAWRNPDHPEHEMYAEWLDPDYDPEAFDPDVITDIFAETQAQFQAILEADITTSGQMTRPARLFWDAIPDPYKKFLLLGSWCDVCDDTTLMVDFRGRIVKGDLLLQGACARCGEEIEMLVEGE